MPQGPSLVFSDWSNFYVITGSSAAALTGLMFVAVTLVADRNTRRTDADGEGMNAFAAPTVVHFSAAFLISSIVSAPWHSVGYASFAIGAAGVCGIAYALRVTLQTARISTYEPLPEDWAWFVVLPFVAYASVIVSAVLLRTAGDAGLFALAGATLLLILIGIHNAWDIVTYIAIERRGDVADDGQEETASAAR